MLVVDGRVGFCGGAGWAYNWTGNAQDPTHWRDTQYELRGPVVAQLQDNFNDNWEELTGQRLCGDGCYPPPVRAGTAVAQMVAGSPFKRGDTIGASNLLAIRAARKSILMEHSYFLPSAEFTKPTMMHGKLLVVDDHLVIAGSGNLDSRSFYLNDENNLHVLDSAVAREQRRMFERDRAKSIPLSEETLKLPLWRRVRGFFGHATKFLL